MPRNTAVGYAVIRKDEEMKKILDLLKHAAMSQGYELVAVFFDGEREPKKNFQVVRRLLDDRRVDAAFTPTRADVAGQYTSGFYIVEDLAQKGEA
jgi:hypothetical protein